MLWDTQEAVPCCRFVLFWGWAFYLFSAIERAPFRAPDKSVFCCGLGTVVSCILFVPGTLQFDNDPDPSLSTSEWPELGKTASGIVECEWKSNESWVLGLETPGEANQTGWVRSHRLRCFNLWSGWCNSLWKTDLPVKSCWYVIGKSMFSAMCFSLSS